MQDREEEIHEIHEIQEAECRLCFEKLHDNDGIFTACQTCGNVCCIQCSSKSTEEIGKCPFCRTSLNRFPMVKVRPHIPIDVKVILSNFKIMYKILNKKYKDYEKDLDSEKIKKLSKLIKEMEAAEKNTKIIIRDVKKIKRKERQAFRILGKCHGAIVREKHLRHINRVIKSRSKKLSKLNQEIGMIPVREEEIYEILQRKHVAQQQLNGLERKIHVTTTYFEMEKECNYMHQLIGVGREIENYMTVKNNLEVEIRDIRMDIIYSDVKGARLKNEIVRKKRKSSSLVKEIRDSTRMRDGLISEKEKLKKDIAELRIEEGLQRRDIDDIQEEFLRILGHSK